VVHLQCSGSNENEYPSCFDATRIKVSESQDSQPEKPPTRGFQAMGRVYAGWGLSQAFYREETWRTIGFSSLEDFRREQPFGIRAADSRVSTWAGNPRIQRSAFPVVGLGR
jgi:hypothetical protein